MLSTTSYAESVAPADSGSRNGGEGGIRTHGRLRDTRSPGAPDRPLQHLSAERVGFEPTMHCCTPLFESGTISHSVTSPNGRKYTIGRIAIVRPTRPSTEDVNGARTMPA